MAKKIDETKSSTTKKTSSKNNTSKSTKTTNNSTKKSTKNNTSKSTKEEVKTKTTTTKSKKNTNSKNKKNIKSTPKSKTNNTKKTVEPKEEIIVKEVNKEEEIEEKLSKTFIEKTKQFIDDSNQYVEDALEIEDIEKTKELENTQIIKIREALKPINKEKRRHKRKKDNGIDEDFLDVNNKDEHLFLKLILIITIIAVFIWAMPKIAYKINKHFVINSDFTPYVPEETVKDEPTSNEPTKSETKLTEEDVENLLNSISSEKLMLPTSTKYYNLDFAEHTMEINGIECYIVDVYALTNEDKTHIAGFAVSTYGEKIFRMNTNGGYEKIEF